MERCDDMGPALAEERAELKHRIEAAEQELAGQPVDRTLVARQLAGIEEACRRFSRRLREIEQQHAALMSLYVACQRLHEGVNQREVLVAIQEIIINFVGSEELAVFELSEDGSALNLVDSFGIDQERYRYIRVGDGSIGRAALRGQASVAGDDLREEGLTACVPLMLGERLVGVIAVFRMLPQKPSLGEDDRNLLELLRAQAGAALYFTRLFDEKQARSATR